MEKGVFTNKVLEYAKENWFKIAILLLLIFVFFKKDLSFRIHLNSPDPTQQNLLPQQQPVQTSRPKKRELMTEDRTMAEAEVKETNQFDLRAIGSHLGLGKSESELVNIDETKAQEFLRRFASVAVEERKKFGIPASITLANGLLQSFAGQRDMAIKGNNYFALPCTSDWQGEKDTYQGTCYRHYVNAWTSFRDHSYYLTTGRNAKLPQLGTTNYKSWAKALEKSVFSEQDDFADKLIQLIQHYDLAKWDTVE